MPATSEKRTLGVSSAAFLALVLPNCICLLLTPFICDRKKIKKPKIKTSGRSVVRSVVIHVEVVTSSL